MVRPEDGWTEFDDTPGALLRSGRGRHWWHAFGRTGGFRMVEFNVAGWTTVLAPGALVGAAVARLLDRHAVVGAFGGATASWLLAVATDRWRYRNTICGFSLGSTTEPDAERMCDDLLAEGLQVELVCELDESDPSGETEIWIVRGRVKDRTAIARKVWPESPAAWR